MNGATTKRVNVSARTLDGAGGGSRRRAFQSASVFAVLLLLAGAPILRSQAGVITTAVAAPQSSSPAARMSAMQVYAALPMSFEANAGQSDPRVKFLVHAPGYSLFLTNQEAVLSLLEPSPAPALLRAGDPLHHVTAPQPHTAAHAVRVKFLGGNEAAAVAGTDELPAKSNYFIGNDPKLWHTNVPNYSAVKYSGIYPGVDAVFHGDNQRFEFDFDIAPGADARSIALEVDGARRMRLNRAGDAVLGMDATHELIMNKPHTYQQSPEGRREIAGRFVLAAGNRIAFKIGPYDHTRPLVIDPTLVYSTYLGGGVSQESQSNAIAVDSSGDAYVTGTVSADTVPFPTTPGSFNPGPVSGNSSFITKLKTDGSGLVYSTYFGGVTNAYTPTPTAGDQIISIAVDSSGAAYFGGLSQSSDTPTTPGSYEYIRPSLYTLPFVAKLSPDGSTLVYSTYLDGTPTSSPDEVTGIAVDSSFNAYVVGFTTATNFPTTTGAFQTVSKATLGTGFVTKFSADGSSLVYSTYLGGSRSENVTAAGPDGAIAVDASNSAYVTGITESSDFPTTTGAYSTTCGSICQDVYVTKLNANGTGLAYSTFLGGGGPGNGYSVGQSIAVDSSGSAFVGGYTTSTSFPVTSGALQTTAGVGFITKLKTDGSGLVYSSYLGGHVESVAVGADDSAVLFGLGNTTYAFDSTPDAFTIPGCPSTGGCFYGFLSKLTADGSGLIFSSPVGADAECCTVAGALDPTGNAYIAGSTSSQDLYTTPGAFETSLPSNYTGFTPFVAKVAFSSSTSSSPTSLSIALSPTPATAGATLTATATIVPAAGVSSVTGTVNFAASLSASFNPVSLCSQASVENNAGSWQAVCTFTEDTAGTYTIAAAYSGDALNQASNNTAPLTVVQATSTGLGTVSGDSNALAINSNNSPGLAYNAVLNSDSSVSLLQDGAILSGQGCPAFSSLSSGINSGAVYVDFANSNIYLTMIADSTVYAAYESINQEGNCTQGPLLQLTANALSNLEMNVDPVQGNVYILNSYGAFPDALYILPTAPWSASSLPTPAQVDLDYSAQYGPIVIDPSNHLVYVNDLGDSTAGTVGTYTTSGFFVYDPNQSTTPANNLQHVTSYTNSSGTTPFNVGTLLTNGAGKLVLVNENPHASTADLTVPIVVIDTTQAGFSFSSPGAALSTISATSPYTAIGGADINAANSIAYVFGFNSNSPTTPGMLLEYNLFSTEGSPETVLSSSAAMPSLYSSLAPWNQLTFNPESTELVLSVGSQYGSGALGLTSPLCAGPPFSLTQLFGSSLAPTPLDYPVVNATSGYVYAIDSGGIDFVAPPPGCSSIPTYTIGGTVSGLTSGTSVTLLDSVGDSVTVTYPTTSFTFPTALDSGASYAVTVGTQPTGETCAVANGSGQVATSNVANVSVTCQANAATYTVGGSVSGLASGASVTLLDNGGDSVTVTYPATSFTFPTALDSGANYAVTVGTQPTGETCTVANGSSQVATSNVTNVAVTCGSSGSAPAQVTDIETITVSDTEIFPDVVDSEPITVTDTVSVTTGPIITTTGPLPAGTLNVAYPTTTITATGGTGGYTWTATGLPPGLSMSPGGVISGTPTSSAGSPYSVTVTVTDAADLTFTAHFSVTIEALPLTITGPGSLPAGAVNVMYPTTTLTATGGSLPYSWTATGLPPGLTMSTGGVISGIPTAAGIYTVLVTVADSVTTASMNFSIAVTASPPSFTITANPDTLTIPQGQTGQTTITLMPVGGYTGTLNLGCSGLPANSICVFTVNGTPTSPVIITGNNQPVIVVLTIETNVNPQQISIASASTPMRRGAILTAAAVSWPGTLLGLIALRRKRKLLAKNQRMKNQRWFGLCVFALLIGALASLAGCVSGGGFGAYVTPAGTSTVTIAVTPGSGTAQTLNIGVTITKQ